MINGVNGREPNLADDCFVADDAHVLGDVHLEKGVSIWYGAVLRGDINEIRIGENSNIQDGTIIHVQFKGQGTIIGRDVVIGHKVVLHSGTIEDGALIGIGAVVLDNARVEKGAIVAAGAVVPPGAVIPAGMMAAGVPAKVLRPVTEAEAAHTKAIVGRYLELGWEHAKLKEQ